MQNFSSLGVFMLNLARIKSPKNSLPYKISSICLSNPCLDLHPLKFWGMSSDQVIMLKFFSSEASLDTTEFFGIIRQENTIFSKAEKFNFVGAQFIGRFTCLMNRATTQKVFHSCVGTLLSQHFPMSVLSPLIGLASWITKKPAPNLS
jgi:hypothetical protein